MSHKVAIRRVLLPFLLLLLFLYSGRKKKRGEEGIFFVYFSGHVIFGPVGLLPIYEDAKGPVRKKLADIKRLIIKS